MKNRLLIAWETESSQTTRLTVKDYAELFKKIPLSEIDNFFAIVQKELDMFGDDKRRKLLTRYIK